jgi:hypothetical protein
MLEIVNLCGHYIIVGIYYATLIIFPIAVFFQFMPYNVFLPFKQLIPFKLQIWWIIMGAKMDAVEAQKEDLKVNEMYYSNNPEYCKNSDYFNMIEHNQQLQDKLLDIEVKMEKTYNDLSYRQIK